MVKHVITSDESKKGLHLTDHSWTWSIVSIRSMHLNTTWLSRILRNAMSIIDSNSYRTWSISSINSASSIRKFFILSGFCIGIAIVLSEVLYTLWFFQKANKTTNQRVLFQEKTIYLTLSMTFHNGHVHELKRSLRTHFNHNILLLRISWLFIF